MYVFSSLSDLRELSHMQLNNFVIMHSIHFQGELRELAIKKRAELAVLAQFKAVDLKEKEILIAEQKTSDTAESKVDEGAITAYDEDLREKEKMQENRERLTENTPEVRQEVRKQFCFYASLSVHSLKSNSQRNKMFETIIFIESMNLFSWIFCLLNLHFILNESRHVAIGLTFL